MHHTKIMKIFLGVDTGGTFTDFVLLADGKLRIDKVLSTPAAPEEAILQGISQLGLDKAVAAGDVLVVHGTTVATNATLERKGVKTAFITNRGLKDMLTLGRQARAELYNLQPMLQPPPVPAELCFETGGRLSSDGEVLEPLTEDDVRQLLEQLEQAKPQAVAINLLFSFIDDRFERQLEQALQSRYFVSRSSAVLPRYREYERGMATWLNAYLGPVVGGYLERLTTALSPSVLSVMQSTGGRIEADQAARLSVNLLLSGPAGGLAAARYLGQLTDQQKLLTFDMGGTSTDVALIDGDIELTNEGKIGDFPVSVPMVDMHTIGAGGGSIAYLDEGGLLQVGPRSAGADPGPACYGKGGLLPTVTDANLILGRIRPDALLGGYMPLDLAAAQQAMAALAAQLGLDIQQAAEGIIQIVNEKMAQALRVISVQRGRDPAHYPLCSFGGAAGLHLCALAESLGITKALFPVNSGVLSALGMLVAPQERLLTQSIMSCLDTADIVPVLEQAVSQLLEQGIQRLVAEGAAPEQVGHDVKLDLRYQGQSSSISCSLQLEMNSVTEAFEQVHQQRYGHRLPIAIECVSVQVRVFVETQPPQLPELPDLTQPLSEHTVQLPGVDEPVRVMMRDQLPPGFQCAGPVIIADSVSTLWLEPGWQLEVDRWGNCWLTQVV